MAGIDRGMPNTIRRPSAGAPKPPRDTKPHSGHWLMDSVRGLWIFNEHRHGGDGIFGIPSIPVTWAVYDHSGYGGHAFPIGGTVGAWSQTRDGGGYRCAAAGVAGQLRAIIKEAQNITSAPFTAAIRYTSRTLVSNNTPQFNKWGGGGQTSWSIFNYNGTSPMRFAYRIDDGSLDQFPYNIGTIFANTIYTIVMTYNINGEAQFWIGGELVDVSSGWTGALRSSNQNITWGGYAANTGTNGGQVNDFSAIWARVLSATEIQELHSDPYAAFRQKRYWRIPLVPEAEVGIPPRHNMEGGFQELSGGFI